LQTKIQKKETENMEVHQPQLENAKNLFAFLKKEYHLKD